MVSYMVSELHPNKAVFFKLQGDGGVSGRALG
jgi:hypothetical protein